MRVGVAGIPGAWSTEQVRAAPARRHQDSFGFDLAECSYDMATGAVSWEGTDLGRLDGVVVKKLGSTTDPLTLPRVHLLQQLEFRGVRVFSPARAIADVQDRLRMSQVLAQGGLPLPRTVVTESVTTAADVVECWGKAIVKLSIPRRGVA